jgi:hypothetical protein
VTSTSSTTRTTPIWVSVILAVVGVALIVVAVLYFVEPAHSLPGFFPGHTAHGTRPRTKHGIAAAVVAVIALAGAWLTSGRKRAGSVPQ